MTDDLFDVESSEDGPVAIVLRVRVQPGAGRSSVTGRHGDALAVKVAAPPLGGRANSECVELVADLLGVRKSQVELVSGEKSRLKRVRVTGIEPGRARDAIARELRSATGRPGSHDRSERQRRPGP
ncbi:MAG: DUF167 domain-containing protein [Acidimicrobiales bacterium]|jgi:uncharacterized protein (TIGR00251 family)